MRVCHIGSRDKIFGKCVVCRGDTGVWYVVNLLQEVSYTGDLGSVINLGERLFRKCVTQSFWK